MRAITLPQPGGPEALVPADVDAPTPGPGEVLVDVVAAGVNRADVMQRLGHYPPPEGASPLPGLEVSGRVAALGDGVEGWTVGSEVCALLDGGGYAEQAVVPAGQLLPVPSGVSLEDAAALPEVACTVWSNVFLVANIQPGQVLLERPRQRWRVDLMHQHLDRSRTAIRRHAGGWPRVFRVRGCRLRTCSAARAARSCSACGSGHRRGTPPPRRRTAPAAT